MLPQGVAKQLAALDVDERASLSTALRVFNRQVGELTVGTICSGSDVVVYVLEVLCRAVEDACGVTFRWRHAWSCESVGWKRQWALQHFSPGAMFADANDLLQSTARCEIQNDIVSIEPVFAVIAGFECDSVSALNKRFQDYRGSCLQERSGKTGHSGCACLDFLRIHRPCFFVFENVVGLLAAGKNGTRDIDTLLECTESFGYLSTYKVLNAESYGSYCVCVCSSHLDCIAFQKVVREGVPPAL